MSVELQTFPFRGSTLSCRVVGNAGAPWLVVNHGMALDCSSFEGLAERFASRWRVLLWDLPGHGKSGPMPRPFDMQVCVDALETVLDAHDVDKAVLLGFSFGGVVSQLLAHRAPQRVDGMIAYGCLSPLLTGPQPLWVMWLGEWIMTRGNWESVRWRFAKLCSAEPDVQRGVFDTVGVLGPDAFRQMTRALLRVRTHDPSFRVNGPLLWVQGERDSNAASLKPVEAALRRSHPSMTSVILPGAGHCAHQEMPAAFDAAVERFLDERFSTA
jgi:pimeloyl-ACP methyl ester carboxylesterase